MHFDYLIQTTAPLIGLVATNSAVRDCSVIGQQPIRDVSECAHAAKELGMRDYTDISFHSHNPRGCYHSEGHLGDRWVHWNGHATGSARNGYVVICKTGTYIFVDIASDYINCIKIYKEKKIT